MTLRRLPLLTACLLVLTACSPTAAQPTPTPEPAPAETTPPPRETEAGDLPVYSNPIDGFFGASHFLNGPSTPEMGFRAGLYQKAWLDEVDHLYGLLERDAAPLLTQQVVDVTQVHQDFMAFVSAQAVAEAYMDYTDGFGQEDGSYGETICRGTGFGGGEAGAGADLARTHVLALREMMDYLSDAPATPYAFDPQTIISQLEAEGLPYTPGAFTVDPKRTDPPRPEPEDPIGAYFTAHPVEGGGSTAEMWDEAALERDIWKAELEGAYDQLIAAAHPTDPAPREALEEAREAYLRFAPGFGRVDGFYRFSGAFMPEYRDAKTMMEMSYGTLAGPQSVWAEAHQYRYLTLRLWEKMGGLGLEPDYRFDPADWADRIEGLKAETG